MPPVSVYTIDLNFNGHVSDLGASYIGKQVEDNTTFSSLNLSTCSFNSKGVKKLSDALPTKDTLEKLNIIY